MITWAAVRAACRKAWEGLKSVPQWVYTVAASLLAYAAWRSARHRSTVGDLQEGRYRALDDRTEAVQDTRDDLELRAQAAELEYQRRRVELERKDQELDSARSVDEIADAVNAAFGGTE